MADEEGEPEEAPVEEEPGLTVEQLEEESRRWMEEAFKYRSLSVSFPHNLVRELAIQIRRRIAVEEVHVDKCETVKGGGLFSSSYVTYTVKVVRPEEQGGVTEVPHRYSDVRTPQSNLCTTRMNVELL